jgi:triacylglycerol lipase
VTVATPHYGTPAAEFFGGFMGKPLLRTMALAFAYSIRFGRLPMSVALRIGKLVARADNMMGVRENVLDAVFEQLLGDFSPERRKAIVDFLTEVASDQSLVFQLTPEGIDLFNATTANPANIHFGSVITRARAPSTRAMLAFRSDVTAYSMYALYTALYAIARRMPDNRIPTLTDSQYAALRAFCAELPTPRDNDGMVPSLSQIWGEVIHVAAADHFDVVGHFRDYDDPLPRIDWLTSGTQFNQAAFRALWRDVAKFMARASEDRRGQMGG